MNINDFTAQAAEEIVRYLPEHVRRDVSVETTEVMKINDQIMHGLVFHSGDEPAPAYYLDELYELYLHGESVEDLLRGLAQAYVETYAAENSNETGVSYPSLPVPAEIPDLSSRAVGRKAGVRLLSKEYNREFLKTVPYRDVGNDYALIADIQIKASDGGVFSTVITNSMAEEYNYDMGTIFDAALENAWRSNAASLRGASELTDGAAEEDGKEISYTIKQDAVTNYTTTYKGYDITNKYKTSSASSTSKKTSGTTTNKNRTSRNARTGDSTHLGLYLVLMVIAAAGVVTMVLRRRRG